MATYAIGDVQGCYRELRSLLRECGFDARRDRLWFVGDLVNRGPSSLDVLRFVADLGDRARTVLGNHDLHLVASARGIRPLRARDTFHDVLDAADGDALIDWLRDWPMAHRDPRAGVRDGPRGHRSGVDHRRRARPRGRAVTSPARAGSPATSVWHVRQRARRVAGLAGGARPAAVHHQRLHADALLSPRRKPRLLRNPPARRSRIASLVPWYHAA